MPRPIQGTFPPYFSTYIALVNANTAHEAVEQYGHQLTQQYLQLPKSRAAYQYAEGKWTLQEMLQHVIDTERILSYRALRIARHDATHLPGFDEEKYVAASGAASRKWEHVLEEFAAVRKATDLLYQSFTESQLEQLGTANHLPTSANSMVYITYGHLLHHYSNIQKHYL